MKLDATRRLIISAVVNLEGIERTMVTTEAHPNVEARRLVIAYTHEGDMERMTFHASGPAITKSGAEHRVMRDLTIDPEAWNDALWVWFERATAQMRAEHGLPSAFVCDTNKSDLRRIEWGAACAGVNPKKRADALAEALAEVQAETPELRPELLGMAAAKIVIFGDRWQARKGRQ